MVSDCSRSRTSRANMVGTHIKLTEDTSEAICPNVYHTHTLIRTHTRAYPQTHTRNPLPAKAESIITLCWWLTGLSTMLRVSAKPYASKHSPPQSLQIHAGTNCHTWRFVIPTRASDTERGGRTSVEAEEEGGGAREGGKGWMG